MAFMEGFLQNILASYFMGCFPVTVSWELKVPEAASFPLSNWSVPNFILLQTHSMDEVNFCVCLKNNFFKPAYCFNAMDFAQSFNRNLSSGFILHPWWCIQDGRLCELHRWCLLQQAQSSSCGCKLSNKRVWVFWNRQRHSLFREYGIKGSGSCFRVSSLQLHLFMADHNFAGMG